VIPWNIDTPCPPCRGKWKSLEREREREREEEEEEAFLTCTVISDFLSIIYVLRWVPSCKKHYAMHE